jgi:hypothetical protein
MLNVVFYGVVLMSASTQDMDQSAEKQRTSFNLPKEVLEIVREIARKRGLSMGEVIRKAITTEKYITDEIEAGSKVLVQKADKSFREVVFR